MVKGLGTLSSPLFKERQIQIDWKEYTTDVAEFMNKKQEKNSNHEEVIV